MDHVRHIFRDIFSGKNSTINYFIERTKYGCYTGREVQSGELIHNSTYKYNNMVTSKERTKKNPKDSKILALKTFLSKIEIKILSLQNFKEEELT